MIDSRILSLLWQRSEQALEALAARFGKRLYLTAVNILQNPQDAEEAVNDTYLAVWNAIPPGRPEPLAGFVYRTGRNTALKKLRGTTAQKRDSRFDLSLDELSGCIPQTALEEAVDARELGRSIDRFLDTVSRESRAIFLRRYWFGDSVKEIAADCGITQSAVSVRLHRIREALKTHLIEEGYYHE